MKPSILVLGSVWSDDVREQVAQAFDCHFMKAIPQAGDALIENIVRTANGRLTAAEALGHREFSMTKLYRSA